MSDAYQEATDKLNKHVADCATCKAQGSYACPTGRPLSDAAMRAMF